MNDNKCIFYKITNNLNGKFYLGVHKGNDPKYMGSGDLIKLAIKKYGRENFTKEVLMKFDTIQEAFEYEAWILTPFMLNRFDCYNIAPGGRGGCGLIKFSDSAIAKLKAANIGKVLSEDHKKKISMAHTGRVFSDDHKKKLSDAATERWRKRK